MRRLAAVILAVVSVVLVLTVTFQYRLAWNDLDAKLEARLSLEGRILVSWLSETLVPIGDLDPFLWDWETSGTGPSPMEITGSSWILLDASGEVAVGPTGSPLYEFRGVSGRVLWEEDRDLIRLAVHSGPGEVIATGLVEGPAGVLKRVYLPVWETSGILDTPWVLAGQAGEEVYSDLFKQQKLFWWSMGAVSVSLLLVLILLFRGIAHTERLEASIREAEESLELESLASTLAHELRNPLSIIQSTAEILLKENRLDGDAADLLSDLIEEVHRSQDVLNTHLHPERGEVPLVEDLLAFSRRYWQHRAAFTASNGIEVEESYPPESSPVSVKADPGRLNQILDNLLRNSMEAMPSGGTIRFGITVDEHSVMLRFQDEGPGPDRGMSFFRDGWKLGSDKPGGKGIGLRLVRKWVTRWGGRLELRPVRKRFLTPASGMEALIFLRRLDGGRESSPASGPE